MFGRLLLPKIMDLTSQPLLVREIYSESQSNEEMDPIWEGVAVFINNGADEYLHTNHRNAFWFELYKDTIPFGGMDGRIGIVTQYEPMDRPIWGVNMTKPWVRVSCHIQTHGDGRICYPSSVSLDARLCTTVPMKFYREAVDITEQEFAREMARFNLPPN